MNLEEVKEWFEIAEEDLYSSQVLNNNHRKPLEVICYLCSQSIEKLLKGFLVHSNIEPPKTHNLPLLLRMCADIDTGFLSFEKECRIIVRYANEVRYPIRIEITEDDANYAIKSVEKMMKFKPIYDLAKSLNIWEEI